MADATAALKTYPYPNGLDVTHRRWLYDGSCTLSISGTYITNGIPISWAMTNAEGGTVIIGAQSWVPCKGSVTFKSLTGATGYNYEYDDTLGTLRIWSAGTELTSGASITTDTISFHAEFSKF